jgi:hypothetical protein
MIPRPWATAIEKPWALVATSLLGLCLCTGPARADAAAGWQQVKARDGITSYRRERPGHALAAFRARAQFEADMWTVLAVLEDVNRASEWTAHCLEMRKLSGVSYRDMLVYAQTDAPWPVRDRDVVTRVITTVLGPRDVTIEVRAVAHGAERAGIVRIPALDARYALHQRDNGELEIEYMIEVDPGGTLPDWLKNLVGRDLAHDTLQRLRQRTEWAVARRTYVERSARLREFGVEAVAARRALANDVTFTNAAP